MRARAIRGLASILCAAALGSCAQVGLDRSPVEFTRPEVATESGLKYEDLYVGDGPAVETGARVTFDYTAWLEDGTRIDSTLDRGVPLEVEVGEASLKCWNEGLNGMRSGGRRRLVVPPELAYGAEGVSDLIPPDATLVFEIDLLEVEP